VQLTSSGGSADWPSWSPDGKRLVFIAQWRGNQDVYVISAKGGVPQRLTTDPAVEKWPYWSWDGQSVYFTSLRSGKEQIWKMPAIGGNAVQITRNTGDVPQESPDGKFIYFQKGWPLQCSVWKVPVVGGKETVVLDSVHCAGQWTVWERGIYFFRPPDEKGRSDICLYEFATGTTSKILTIERRIGSYIASSADGRKILYTQFDQSGSDLMLVENFR
jgi:Tol biopolymer transport system component